MKFERKQKQKQLVPDEIKDIIVEQVKEAVSNEVAELRNEIADLKTELAILKEGGDI